MSRSRSKNRSRELAPRTIRPELAQLLPARETTCQSGSLRPAVGSGPSRFARAKSGSVFCGNFRSYQDVWEQRSFIGTFPLRHDSLNDLYRGTFKDSFEINKRAIASLATNAIKLRILLKESIDIQLPYIVRPWTCYDFYGFVASLSKLYRVLGEQYQLTPLIQLRGISPLG